MSLLTGKEFNAKYTGKTLVKLTSESECHNGFQFKDGLNVDTVPFNPTSECKPGGIYFCELSKFFYWTIYNEKQMIWYRKVTIPDDAQVYVESDKFKADKLILSERHEISIINDDSKILFE